MVDLLGKEVSERAPRGAIPRWANRYGYSERSVKQFLAIGRDRGQMPPFDQPEKMEEWGTVHLGRLTNRFKAGILKALDGHGVPGGDSGLSLAGPPAAAPPEPFEMPDLSDADFGMEQQLRVYQRELALLVKLRERALLASEFSKANQYLEQQNKVSAEIRQLERILPSVLEQRGEMMKATAVRLATVEFLTMLKRQLLGRGSKAAARLRDARNDADMQEAWRAEINAVFTECTANGFGEGLVLE